MMKKAQQMTTMLPMGFREDISVSTTSFRPWARLMTLGRDRGEKEGFSQLGSSLVPCPAALTTHLGSLVPILDSGFLGSPCRILPPQSLQISPLPPPPLSSTPRCQSMIWWAGVGNQLERGGPRDAVCCGDREADL